MRLRCLGVVLPGPKRTGWTCCETMSKYTYPEDADDSSHEEQWTPGS
jgi:hypothetical protein